MILHTHVRPTYSRRAPLRQLDLPHLRILRLCVRLSDGDIVPSLFGSLGRTSLESLELKNVAIDTPEALLMPELRYLSVAKITGDLEGFAAAICRCGQLRTLNLVNVWVDPGRVPTSLASELLHLQLA